MVFFVKRALKLPGYHYYDSEVKENEDKGKSLLLGLSFYTRFRIWLDIVMYEHLSKFFVFRWIFNIIRIFLALLDVYPILALISFGKKYAFVEIMKGNK